MSSVKFSFSNYLYSFGGVIYKQRVGGPIGSRLTMASSRIVMYRWSKSLRKSLGSSGVKVLWGKYYMDDIRLILGLLRNRERFNGSRIEYRKELEIKEWGKTEAVRATREELEKLMNYIYPMLKFTTETAEDFPDNTLPTLDFRLWVMNFLIYYSFFEKPMQKKFTLMSTFFIYV